MADELKASFTLTGEKGKAKGKVFAFDRKEVSVGRTDSCDLVLEDDSVSRNHATIYFESGEFLIKDSSTNGTFINGNRIRGSQKLNHGDVIGIGPDNVLRYGREAEVTGVVREKKGKGRGQKIAISGITGQVKSFLEKRPMLGAGLGVYLILILLLFFYLALSPSGRGRVTSGDADRLVRETERYLTRFFLTDKGLGTATNFALAAQLLSEGKALQAIEGEDPGAIYMVFSKYRQALRLCGFPSLSEYQRIRKEKGADGGVSEQAAKDLEGVLQRILTRIHELAFLGWLAESHGRRDEAVRIYERILAAVPDEGSPPYRFALARIRDLKK